MPVPNSYNLRIIVTCVISGFRREADGNRTLVGCYAASRGNSLPTFRDNVLLPIGCPETSVTNYFYSLCYAASRGNSLPTFRGNLLLQIGCPETSVTNYLYSLCYAASRGNSLPTFRGNLLLPIGCPETSVTNHLYSLCNNPEERSYLV